MDFLFIFISSRSEVTAGECGGSIQRDTAVQVSHRAPSAKARSCLKPFLPSFLPSFLPCFLPGIVKKDPGKTACCS
ncbi:hypothetical protein E3U43_021052, partial [Larimichthys crocea]